ncbi:MAG TPA: ribosome-associated translation inhibitor RaiA [Candidatus Saccharimonadales bacterium]|jgi:putative sigma-54 modulation protein|nr:ribosome-associated translation inhibitor RaiA [Candidatus Saccharimonadales bacterium]
MLQKFELQGVHVEVNDSMRKYVNRKIGGLDRYLSRHDRESAHGEVTLRESKSKSTDHCTCEAILYLPHQKIVAKERAMNMFAAVDIVEAKLKQQIKKYKEKHQNGKTHRHIFARLRGRNA